MKLKKRGQATHEIYYFIIYLLLLGFILLVLSNYVTSIADDTFFQKLYFSRDIALLTSTFFAAPGDLQAAYSGKTDGFEVEFEQSRVILSEESNAIFARYTFLNDTNMIFNPNTITNNKIQLLKIGFNITAGSDLIDIKLLECPKLSTQSSLSNKRGVLNPESDASDKGPINPANPSFNEAEISHTRYCDFHWNRQLF